MEIDLLRKPVVDLAGMPVGTVDEVETVLRSDGEEEIATLVVEPRRPRFGRAAAPGERMRISWDLVAFCDRSITLMVRRHLLRPS
ncbi:PRC-barrel domain-containing protein [Dactylosporangium sp. CS-033363]|uniref:PRC-barrel domain-containing protein n=1 Tax=Dactylosporangium sp. CS-033363 TaxID=3239935 RepID=UPI003D8CF72B